MKSATSFTLAACVCCTLLATPVAAAVALVYGSLLYAAAVAVAGVVAADVLDTAGEMLWDSEPANW